MSNAKAVPAFVPPLMTDKIHAQLQEAGYILPDSWPFPARVAPEMNSRAGWSVRTAGHKRDENQTVYVAPDGSQFVRATNGARVVLVGLSRRVSAIPLRVAPGTRRPSWVIQDTPKGEIPEHLRAWLLKPGQKITKGDKRQVEALLVEPEHSVSAKGHRVSHAVAILGPRPDRKKDPKGHREWGRNYGNLLKDPAYRAAHGLAALN